MIQERETSAGTTLRVIRQRMKTAPERGRGANASKVRAASFIKVFQCLIAKSVQSPLPHVLLEMPIPLLGFIVGEPSAECRQVLTRQSADSVFNVIQANHA